MKKEMYDDNQHLEVTFNRDALPQYLLQAQFSELIELKKIIYSWSVAHSGEKMNVLDIGIGDARILTHLSGINEIWSIIRKYIGIDVTQECVNIANEQIKILGVEDKAKATLFDATDITNLEGAFDLIITTWFTAGNFYPEEYDADSFAPGALDLSQHPKFTSIFKQAYGKLKPGGEIIIGSMYIDNEQTRLKQEDAYRFFGRDVITDERDCFTATKNGWRSQRFTKERVYNYLSFIPKEQIEFIDLDTYQYAMLVRIKKP